MLLRYVKRSDGLSVRQSHQSHPQSAAQQAIQPSSTRTGESLICQIHVQDECLSRYNFPNIRRYCRIAGVSRLVTVLAWMEVHLPTHVGQA